MFPVNKPWCAGGRDFPLGIHDLEARDHFSDVVRGGHLGFPMANATIRDLPIKVSSSTFYGIGFLRGGEQTRRRKV